MDATPGMTHADLQAFQRAPRERRSPNKRDAQRIEKLQTKLHELAEAVDAALDDEDEEKADALQEEGERLGEQLQALEDGLLDYAANVKAAAGAIVTIDRDGQAAIHRGCCAKRKGRCARWQRLPGVSAAKAKPRTRTQAGRRGTRDRRHV